MESRDDQADNAATTKSAKKIDILHFPGVEGLPGCRNDVFYMAPKSHDLKGRERDTVYFFGGDVQDGEKAMSCHPENCGHVRWCLEATTEKLANVFPTAHVFTIRPASMTAGSYSCYENFVPVADIYGSPKHELTDRALRHLHALSRSLEQLINIREGVNVEVLIESQLRHGFVPAHQRGYATDTTSKILLGFSKGAVVLNQMLYAMKAASNEKHKIHYIFAKTITKMYWLDGGHSGEKKETYITNLDILRNFAAMQIAVDVRVTPYQVRDKRRPWIEIEEQRFANNLKFMDVDVNRLLCNASGTTQEDEDYEEALAREGAFHDINSHFAILETLPGFLP